MSYGRLTRRELLRITAAVGSAVALPGLASCGGSTERRTAESTGGGAGANTGGRVRTLMWEGYELREPEPATYELAPTFMVANEDPINKQGSYDISVGIEGIYPTLHTAGVMQSLDHERLTNWSLLDPAFPDDPLITYDGEAFGMPYIWATLGFTHLQGEGPAPERLSDLLDDRFRGKIGIGDDGNSVIIQIARMLGLGGARPGFLTAEEMDQVFTTLEDFKAHAFGVISNPYAEYAGAYTRGEILTAFPDNAPTTLRVEEAGMKASVVFSEESAFSWIDALFIAADVGPSDEIYAFLDDGLSTETQYAIGKELGWAVANQEAMQRLAKEGPLWSYYADREAVFAAAPNVEWPPVESDEFETYDEWLKRWQDFKSS